ncbi:phage tail assembly chaperone [Pseudomonas sp. 22-AL-CL-001]|uniref:phage tail assembly chaperone n=1 Tax=Pseudomonas alabamensis TaxID=3064349 RepID=UPI0027141A5A|nr:phage tail assembly chaperone [Pseudomonas sp. 22-AL-CL-001]MDO7911337.1 phage tail assembly chaperone [Pseudomonas sp. 22-AL-CL-001]
MAKIKIAQNPTFSAAVQMPRVGGEPVEVQFEFRYLDRLALAEMFDRWNQAREQLTEQAKEGATWAEVTSSEVKLQADQLKEIVQGWGLEDEFTGEAVHQLVLTCAGAPKAVIEAYQAAYAPARLGN